MARRLLPIATSRHRSSSKRSRTSSCTKRNVYLLAFVISLAFLFFQLDFATTLSTNSNNNAHSFTCDPSALFPTPVSALDTTTSSSSTPTPLVVLVALAKTLFYLNQPFALQLPAPIVNCETVLKRKRTNNNDTAGIYHNVIIPQTALQERLPLDMPEKILDVILARKSSKQQQQALTIIDIGANVGQFALPLARQGHVVYSFEPVDATCAILRQTVAKEQLGEKVHVTCAGIDQVEEVKSFGYIMPKDEAVVPPSASYTMINPTTPGAVVKSTVRTGPVDSFLPPNHGPIHVFKTDTQGNEESVLRGSQQLLCSQTHRPRILLVEFSHYLLHTQGTNPLTILEIIYQCDYVCTHLRYHHAVGKDAGGRDLFDYVDTPVFEDMSSRSSSASVSFADFVASVGPHGQWKINRTKVRDEFQKSPGWTDLLCFG